jgi:hypothetical protein
MPGIRQPRRSVPGRAGVMWTGFLAGRLEPPGADLAVRSGSASLGRPGHASPGRHCPGDFPGAPLHFDCTVDDGDSLREPSRYLATRWVSFGQGDPVKYTDPSGHYGKDTTVCLDYGWCGSSGSGFSLNFAGYTSWERQILQKLYNDGGNDARHGVDYILENRIRIEIGEEFSITFRKVDRLFMYMHVPAIQGDWQSLGDISGWFTENTIFLNSNNTYNQMPSDWDLSIIIHEAWHIEQGSFAYTKKGELEAFQVGLRVYASLGGKSIDELSAHHRNLYYSESGWEYFVRWFKTPGSYYWIGLLFYP